MPRSLSEHSLVYTDDIRTNLSLNRPKRDQTCVADWSEFSLQTKSAADVFTTTDISYRFPDRVGVRITIPYDALFFQTKKCVVSTH